MRQLEDSTFRALSHHCSLAERGTYPVFQVKGAEGAVSGFTLELENRIRLAG